VFATNTRRLFFVEVILKTRLLFITIVVHRRRYTSTTNSSIEIRVQWPNTFL